MAIQSVGTVQTLLALLGSFLCLQSLPAPSLWLVAGLQQALQALLPNPGLLELAWLVVGLWQALPVLLSNPGLLEAAWLVVRPWQALQALLPIFAVLEPAWFAVRPRQALQALLPNPGLLKPVWLAVGLRQALQATLPELGLLEPANDYHHRRPAKALNRLTGAARRQCAGKGVVLLAPSQVAQLALSQAQLASQVAQLALSQAQLAPSRLAPSQLAPNRSSGLLELGVQAESSQAEGAQDPNCNSELPGLPKPGLLLELAWQLLDPELPGLLERHLHQPRVCHHAAGRHLHQPPPPAQSVSPRHRPPYHLMATQKPRRPPRCPPRCLMATQHEDPRQRTLPWRPLQLLWRTLPRPHYLATLQRTVADSARPHLATL